MRFRVSDSPRDRITGVSGAVRELVVDVERGSLTPLDPRDGSVQAVSWSPRGDRLAIIWGRVDSPTCLATMEARPASDSSLTVVAEGVSADAESPVRSPPDAGLFLEMRSRGRA